MQVRILLGAPVCPCGATGRRGRLKNDCHWPCGFESRQGHQSCRCGEMVYTPDSNPGHMQVRILPPAPSCMPSKALAKEGRRPPQIGITALSRSLPCPVRQAAKAPSLHVGTRGFESLTGYQFQASWRGSEDRSLTVIGASTCSLTVEQTTDNRPMLVQFQTGAPTYGDSERI